MSDNEKKNTSAAGNTDSTETGGESKDNKDKKPKKEISPEKAERRKYSRRRFKYGGAAAAITALVVAAVVLVNVIMAMVAERVNMSIDITPDSLFEISQESKDYLAVLNEPVEIICMSDELTFSTSTYIYFKQAYEVLKKYTIYSDNVTLKFVDMTKDPTYAENFKSMYKGDISQYSIVVKSDKRIKVIAIQDLYNTETDYYSMSTKITSSKAEQELTSAIMYVTDPDPMNAVVFNSESAGDSYDNVYDLLIANGYNVSEINPLVDEIPEDTDIIVINAPLNDYDEELIQKLYDFLDNGGKLGKNLIYIADYNQNTTANIDSLLMEYGIKVGSGVVGDSNTKNTSSASNFIIGTYIDTADNVYADNVSDTTLPVLSYYSRPVELLFDASDSRQTQALIKTENTAFVFTNEMQKAMENGEDIKPDYGVYNTMAVGRKFRFDENNNTVYTNVLVLGSANMLAQSITEATYYNNGDYFISALNTMTGKTGGITIVAKDLTSDTFEITQQVYSTCFFVFVLMIPLIVIVCGTVVYFRRRHK